MKFRTLLLILSISILAACGSDDSATNEELEAAQAGVELLSESDIEELGGEISNVESAKKVCAIELSQIFGGDRNSPSVKKICDCIVDNVSLAEINRNGVLEADKTITNKCIGN